MVECKLLHTGARVLARPDLVVACDDGDCLWQCLGSVAHGLRDGVYALWLQVCGVVNDKRTNSHTTRGTMAQSFNLLTLSVTKHDTILSLSSTNGILED